MHLGGNVLSTDNESKNQANINNKHRSIRLHDNYGEIHQGDTHVHIHSEAKGDGGEPDKKNRKVLWITSILMVVATVIGGVFNGAFVLFEKSAPNINPKNVLLHSF